MLKDTKAALGSAVKPDITHVRTPLLNYTSRACEYGNDKYERANYARPTGDAGAHDVPTKADADRLRAYLRACVGHIYATLDSIEVHQAGDPNFEDVAGLRAAAFAPDTDEPAPSSPVGASYLPHLAHASASLNMALQQAVMCGLLPKDPGRTWKLREAAKPPAEPNHELVVANTSWIW